MINRNPLKQKGLFETLKFLALAIETGLQLADLKDSGPLSRIVQTKYLENEPSYDSQALAASYIDDPDKILNNKKLHALGLALDINHIVRDKWIDEDILGILALFAMAILKNEGLIKNLPFDEKTKVGSLGTIDEEIEVRVIILNDYARFNGQFHNDKMPVLAQSLDGHYLYLNGKDFHPEIGAQIVIKGVVGGHIEETERINTQINNVVTSSCHSTKLFIHEVGHILANTVISNEGDYADLRNALHHLGMKYYVESPDSIVASFTHISDPTIHNTIISQDSLNEHSNYKFNLADNLVVKKIFLDNGTIEFKIVE